MRKFFDNLEEEDIAEFFEFLGIFALLGIIVSVALVATSFLFPVLWPWVFLPSFACPLIGGAFAFLPD